MAYFRCVGGPNDGQCVEIAAGEKDIVLQHAPEQQLKPPINSPYVTPEDTAIIIKTRYTLRSIMQSDDYIIRYLAPEDWTDERAVRYQFTK